MNVQLKGIDMKKLALMIALIATCSLSYSESIPPDDSYHGVSSSQKSSQSLTNANGKLIAYLPGWGATPSAGDLVAAGYTHVIVAFGVFSTVTPGQIISAFETVTPSYVKSLQAAGLKVLLSLGGASTNIVNTSVDFHSVLSKVSDPSFFQEAFVNSLEDMMTQYGFDGFDFDIEHGLVGAGTMANPSGDIAVLAASMKALHTKHPDILLSLAPQMANISATQGFNEPWGNYAALVMQTAPILSWVGIQLYNSGCSLGLDGICYGFDSSHPESNVDTYVAMAADLLEDWPTKDKAGRATGFQPYVSYLDPSQIVLGFPAINNQGISDGSPSADISLIKRSIACLRTAQSGNGSCHEYIAPRAYSNLGGVFEWEVTYDQSTNYNFAKSLKACVMTGDCQ